MFQAGPRAWEGLLGGSAELSTSPRIMEQKRKKKNQKRKSWKIRSGEALEHSWDTEAWADGAPWGPAASLTRLLSQVRNQAGEGGSAG